MPDPTEDPTEPVNEEAAKDPARPPISRRKRVVFSLVILFVLWLATDLALFLFLRKLGAERPVFFRASTPTEAQLAGFGRHYFHPAWGWDIDDRKKGALGTRSVRDYEKRSRYKIKAFGDSFTYGWHVEANETWTAFVEATDDWACLNYGVPGYGTDQALLKYQDCAVPSEYTILAIYDEDIGRMMTRYYAFYDRGKTFYVKPRFALSEDGAITKIESPIKQASDLSKLRDPVFVAPLREEDYWFQYYNRLNAPRELKWPASLTVVPHLNYFIRFGSVYVRNKISPNYESKRAANKYYHLYDEGSDGLRLMEHVVDTFVETARDRGETPIVVVFPNVHTVDIMREFQRCPYQTLVDHLGKRDAAFIDFGSIFAAEDYGPY